MIKKREIDNLSLKINLIKRKFPESPAQVVSDFRNYIKKPGVWACYGIKKDDPSNTWVCLMMCYTERAVDKHPKIW